VTLGIHLEQDVRNVEWNTLIHYEPEQKLGYVCRKKLTEEENNGNKLRMETN
jgi:hypothetical protein